MNDWRKVFKTRSKDERAYERRSVAKSLMAAGHTRAVALKKAKIMVKQQRNAFTEGISVLVTNA